MTVIYLFKLELDYLFSFIILIITIKIKHFPSEGLLIHSTILLNVCCEPGDISSAVKTTLNKTDKNSWLHEAYILVGEGGN